MTEDFRSLIESGAMMRLAQDLHWEHVNLVSFALGIKERIGFLLFSVGENGSFASSISVLRRARHEMYVLVNRNRRYGKIRVDHPSMLTSVDDNDFSVFVSGYLRSLGFENARLWSVLKCEGDRIVDAGRDLDRMIQEDVGGGDGCAFFSVAREEVEDLIRYIEDGYRNFMQRCVYRSALSWTVCHG